MDPVHISDTTEKWCLTCRRLKAVGCACGLTFAEKVRGQAVNLGSFKAVRN